MARKSLRLASSPATASQHKRAASNSTPNGEEATRSKKQKATPTKSQYFKESGTTSNVADGDDMDEDISSQAEGESSAFEDEDEPTDSEVDDEDEYDSELEESLKRRKTTPAKKGAGSNAPKLSAANRTKDDDLLRHGVKAGLGPGKEVIIKKPKARSAGKTPYRDETIHPNTMLFLEDLKANNERHWLKSHDADFRQSEKDWHTFVETLTEKLSQIDDTIPELPVKDIIFRIYRDVRFSKDPTPYKPHFSAAWSRTGRKGPYAAYYVQVSPYDGSFVGGGLWHPEAGPIAAMRRNIDRRPRQLKDVLMDPPLQREFLGGTTKSESKAVKAFVSSNSENALKTKPKGFDADHPDIDLLRLRNYTLGRSLAENEVLGDGGLARICELLTAMKPFVTYLNSVVMPDEEAEESGESDEEDEDGEDDE